MVKKKKGRKKKKRMLEKLRKENRMITDEKRQHIQKKL